MAASAAPLDPLAYVQTASVVSHILQTRCDSYLKRTYGLSWPGFTVLRTLRQAGPTSAKRLTAALACTHSNITGIVDRLERDGWVRRTRSTQDRRVIYLELTPKGEKIGEVEEGLHRFLTLSLEPWFGEMHPLFERLQALEALVTGEDAAEA
ncbi:DNA-binding MarR family transcriptional regulator [Symbiobacterium terraclitae]|uniref:DNA-binding MarR family transcriptional regulator n=1 Tax=Symbiobacterium terraclitae TaxID=557451 RepID=A0ABS4JQM8_9FIRM|nr:MarR family transcriptional regulator [Symbiobacterium terraclitae]MBP2017191.1 DNA-binding MarR family transcriptional regulator [Symbiobacterium terraclitae]